MDAKTFEQFRCLRATDRYSIQGTLTLKQRVMRESGLSQLMDRNLAQSTAIVFRDRLLKQCIGQRRWRQGERPSFLSFLHVGSAGDNHHIHFATVLPDSVSFDEMTLACENVLARLECVKERKEFKLIEDRIGSGSDAMLGYFLKKEGWDAFCPEASFVTFRQIG
jgi:hypothetical protein